MFAIKKIILFLCGSFSATIATNVVNNDDANIIHKPALKEINKKTHDIEQEIRALLLKKNDKNSFKFFLEIKKENANSEKKKLSTQKEELLQQQSKSNQNNGQEETLDGLIPTTQQKLENLIKKISTLEEKIIFWTKKIEKITFQKAKIDKKVKFFQDYLQKQSLKN